LTGGPVDANGMVTGYVTGYLGKRPAVINSAINACIPNDFDGDGVVDGDNFYYDAGNNSQYDVDLDNDNDGISDFDEGCRLSSRTFADRQIYNFENPPN